MRTAAKAAVLGGFRSAEAAVARRTPRSSVVPVAPGDSGLLSVALVSGETGRAEKPLATERRDFDDWDFAGVEEELFDAIHPAPRIVFGGVPTLQEAKEATSDLKDAIDMIYFSPNSAKQSVGDIQGSTSSENSVVIPEVPKHVVNAFSLLQGSPEAQNVVASLASDKNVWDAIMKNDKVMAFYKNQESAVLSPERSADPEESVDSSTTPTPKNQISDSSPLWDWVNNIKLGVSEMMTNISNLLQDFMGASAGASSSKTSPYTVTGDSVAAGVGVGASFLALAVAAILVVLFKRGA